MSSLNGYSRHRTGDETLERIQDRVEEAFSRSDSNFLTGTVLVEGVQLRAASTQTIQHGLGYVYRGFMVVRMSAPAIVTDVTNSKSNRRTVIELATTADTIVSIVVF